MTAEPKPALEIKGLCVKAGRFDLTDISFLLPHGGTLSVLGRSGSGKTTLARALLGLAKPSSGELFLDGAPVGKDSRGFFRCRPGAIQAIFQNPYSSLDPHWKVKDIIAEPRHHDRPSGRELASLMNRLGLAEEMLDRYPRELSGGERQRVAIGRAVIGNPSVIIADEPTAALDAPAEKSILELVSGLSGERRSALVLITHNLNRAAALGGGCIVLDNGMIAEAGPAKELLASPASAAGKALARAAKALL